MSPPPTARTDLTLTGLCLHVSLWLLTMALVVFLGRASLFPGRPYLTWVLIAGLVIFVGTLWAARRSRAVAVRLLGVVSLLGLVIVLTEAAVTVIKPTEIAVTRFPYPYRMHGAAPGLAPADSHLRITTNDTGLRDSESIPRKPPGELRVVVLGGSAVLGFGSADDQTAPYFLERLLADHLREHPLEGVDRVRVINAGQGYYNSTQELVFFVTELALYEPDLVVVADGYNDLHHALVWGNRPPANEVTSTMLEGLMQGGGGLRKVGWADATYTALQASYFGNRTRGGYAPKIVASTGFGFAAERPRGRKDSAEFLPLVKHRLVMNWVLMHGLAESFGAKTLFALQPTIFVKEPLAAEERAYLDGLAVADLVGRSWVELERFVEQEAGRLGLPVFESDRHVKTSSERLFTDYCHMRAEGNRLWARSMAERIERELADWSGGAQWEGVRFPFREGDPLWRPARLSRPGAWR